MFDMPNESCIDGYKGIDGLAGGTEGKAAHDCEPNLSRADSVCLHQGPCLAPHGADHSPSFWHMASLEVAFGLCSTAAAAQQVPTKHTEQQQFSFLDLSCNTSGAAQYLLNHASVKAQSAVLMGGEAAQQLCSAYAEATADAVPQCKLQLWPSDFTSDMATPSAVAHGSRSSGPVSSLTAVSHEGNATPSNNEECADHASHKQQPCSTTSFSSAEPCQASLKMNESQHSLASYRALAAVVGQCNLVVGELCSCAEQQASDAGGTASQHKCNKAETPGVMETEYSSAYRARVLWECAVALTCLKPGRMPNGFFMLHTHS